MEPSAKGKGRRVHRHLHGPDLAVPLHLGDPIPRVEQRFTNLTRDVRGSCARCWRAKCLFKQPDARIEKGIQ